MFGSKLSFESKDIPTQVSVMDEAKLISNSIGEQAPSILASDLKLTGDLVSDGNLDISGTIEGNINGGFIIVRNEGKIKGKITANYLIIKGFFEGDIIANTLTVSSTATVRGNFKYKLINIESGASVNGTMTQIGLNDGVKEVDSSAINISFNNSSNNNKMKNGVESKIKELMDV